MVTFLNNSLAQLFDLIEEKSKVNFATFTTNDGPKESNIINKDQVYMKNYENTYDGKIYKYLYDPDLAFDWRFHQRLASISADKRKNPWSTILFNTGPVQPLTNVLSHVYTGVEYYEGKPYSYLTRRVSVPINMTLISNDMGYLYETTEKIAMYFDRIVNFHYDEALDFGGLFIKEYSKAGMAKNIRQVNLNKLNTETRGSLVTSAFTFDLIYFVVDSDVVPLRLLEKVILEIKIKGHGEPLNLVVTE